MRLILSPDKDQNVIDFSVDAADYYFGIDVL